MIESYKKCLVVDLTKFYGGGQKFVANIYNFSKQKNRYFFAVSNRKLYDDLDTENKIFIDCGFLETIRVINAYIVTKQIYAVLLNGNRPIYFAPFIKAPKKLAYRHTSNNAFNGLKAFIAPVFLNVSNLFCSNVIVLYQKAKREIWQQSKVVVINNGIEIKDINLGKLANSKQYISIVCISRLDRSKGVDWLLETFYDTFNSRRDVLLQIAGDGDIKQELLTKIEQLGINAKLLGFVNNINELFVDSDIFVLPSKYEAFPLSILEAMNYSLPVIATNTGGISEIIDTGKEGFVVNYRDTEALKNAMTLLVNNAEERKRMGQNAFNKVGKFDINHNINQIENLLDTL